MDSTTEAIATYAASLGPDGLPDSVFHEAKRRLVDSMACALGAVDAPPARIARALAGDTTGTVRTASVIGLPTPTSMELAAFANTVMVRYLDYNDMQFTLRGGGGHPSDLIPTSLAVGEGVGATGRDVLAAIALAYEVNASLAGAVWLRARGWDQGLHVVAASALSAGKLLGLDREQMGHALSLAVTPNIPVRQTRVGHLSMWKGCATAGAARNGVFAALMAYQGMTGPPDPFEGKAGIWAQVTGPFDLSIPATPGQFAIEDVATKMRPAEYNSQGPLDLITDLASRFDVADLESLEVETYFLAYDEIGSEPAKWDPRSRETADHSLPYLLAVTMVDGDISAASFTPERIMDPDLRPLMAKIRITENAEFTDRFPQELNCRMTARLKSGEEVRGEIKHPRGHPENQVDDDAINEKFDSVVAAYRPASEARACRDLRDAIWGIDSLDDVSAIMEPLRMFTTNS